MDERFKNLILEYVQSVGEITLLNLTKNLKVSEKRAVQVLSELEKDGVIERDFSFVYYDKTRLKKYKIEESPEDVLERKHALAKMEKRLKKITRKRASDDFFDTFDDLGDDTDYADVDYDDCVFIFEEDENLETAVSDSKLEHLKEIIECFKRDNDFVLDGTGYNFNVGITYPDDIEMKFRLFYNDGIFLSDNGLTFNYLDGELDGNDENFNLVKEILNDYSVQTIQTKKGVELRIKIRDKKSAFMCMTFLIVAIERIIHII